MQGSLVPLSQVRHRWHVQGLFLSGAAAQCDMQGTEHGALAGTLRFFPDHAGGRACLQAKNEELAQRAVGVSQEELDATRAEFEARLGAAERKERTDHTSVAAHPAGMPPFVHCALHACCRRHLRVDRVFHTEVRRTLC